MSKSPCLNPFEHILHVSVHDKILRKWNGNLNDLCSKSLKPRQALYDSVHSSWRTRDKWISVEEAEAAWFHIFQRGHQAFSTDDLPKTKLEAAKFLDVSTDLPYPCGHPNCTKFHDNTHGFCDKHRFRRVWWNACSGVMKACHWMELVLLLTIQAAADIQSRILLLLILVSLLPVTCIFLEESSGMSAAFMCVTFLIAVVCSCFYTARRLDGMQQRIFKMALATEAQYYQVLQPEAETNQHLVRVSTILSTCSDGSFQEVLQTEQDLRRNYELAKSHISIFQTAVCEPLVSTGLEVVAKIKSLTELDEREGAVDILHCEVWCDSLQQVQHAWDMLKDLDGVEIVSARDFFAVASSKKCCQIVMSLQGYLATVFLLEKSLSTLEAHQGICDAANSLGLLDKTSAAGWELSQRQVGSEVPGCIHPASRGVAAHTAGLFRSVRGAKGVGAPQAKNFHFPPPWGLPKLGNFHFSPPWGLPKLGNFHFSPPWGLPKLGNFHFSPLWGLPKLGNFHFSPPWGLPKLGNFHFSPPWGLPKLGNFHFSPP